MEDAASSEPAKLQDGFDVDVVRHDIERSLTGMLLIVTANCASKGVELDYRWPAALLFTLIGGYYLFTSRSELGLQRVRVRSGLVEIGQGDGFSQHAVKSWHLHGSLVTVRCRGVSFELVAPSGKERELLESLRTVIRRALLRGSASWVRVVVSIALLVGGGGAMLFAERGELLSLAGCLILAIAPLLALLAQQRQKAKLPYELK